MTSPSTCITRPVAWLQMVKYFPVPGWLQNQHKQQYQTSPVTAPCCLLYVQCYYSNNCAWHSISHPTPHCKVAPPSEFNGMILHPTGRWHPLANSVAWSHGHLLWKFHDYSHSLFLYSCKQTNKQATDTGYQQQYLTSCRPWVQHISLMMAIKTITVSNVQHCTVKRLACYTSLNHEPQD